MQKKQKSKPAGPTLYLCVCLCGLWVSTPTPAVMAWLHAVLLRTHAEANLDPRLVFPCGAQWKVHYRASGHLKPEREKRNGLGAFSN